MQINTSKIFLRHSLPVLLHHLTNKYKHKNHFFNTRKYNTIRFAKPDNTEKEYIASSLQLGS